MAANNYNDLDILNDEQLQKLASQIRYQEATVIHRTNFSTQKERDEFVYDSKSNQDSVLALLATGKEVETKYQDDAVKGPIAKDLHLYIVYCCNSALQAVANYHTRKNYLQKIRDHVDELVKVLDERDAADQKAVAVLADGVAQYKSAMYTYTLQFKSTLSANFSKVIKAEGVKYENLIQRYQNKLGFKGTFKDLTDEQKTKVYDSIIAASNRDWQAIADEISEASKALGNAVKMFKIGSVVWDIFSTDHVLETVTRDAVEIAANAGGAELGQVIGAALATELIESEAEALFVVLAGIAGSIAGAFIVGAFAGLLLDAIFSTASFPNSTKGLHCYVNRLPDGVALARIIAHDGGEDSNTAETSTTI